ncbi:MAG: acyltransferase [Candidatus Thorarchaeota archaeon]
MTERKESWISIAKAVALILVIFIHSTPRDALSGYLTGFVMPAFFILYGVSHNTRKCRYNLRKYIVNRARSLMIPYFVLNLVMILIYAVVYPQVNYGYAPVDVFFWILYGNGPVGKVNHLWFLRTMFFAIILFSIVDRFLHDKSITNRIAIAAIAPGIGVMLKFGLGFTLVPWGLDSILIAFSFMLIGSEIRRFRHLSPWSVNRHVDAIGLVGAFIVYSIITIMNGFVNIGESIYGVSIYNYMITGILGTYIVCLLSFYAGKLSGTLSRYATSFNNIGQEVYEIHPLLIVIIWQLLGGLDIWLVFPIEIASFALAIFLPSLFALYIISRVGILQVIFLGLRKTETGHPRPAFPVPEPNGDNGGECMEEQVIELVMKTRTIPEDQVDDLKINNLNAKNDH